MRILEVSRAMLGGRPTGRQRRQGWGRGGGSGVRVYGTWGNVFRFMCMSGCAPVCLPCPKNVYRCSFSVLAGLCASRVGAAEPMRTDVTPLDGAYTIGQGWPLASLVTAEDDAPALDTVVVDSQGALGTNVQVAAESESAGVFTVTFVHVHANIERHSTHVRSSTSTCTHELLPCSSLA